MDFILLYLSNNLLKQIIYIDLILSNQSNKFINEFIYIDLIHLKLSYYISYINYKFYIIHLIQNILFNKDLYIIFIMYYIHLNLIYYINIGFKNIVFAI